MYLKDSLKAIWSDLENTNDFSMYYSDCYVVYNDKVWLVTRANDPEEVRLDRVFIDNVEKYLTTPPENLEDIDNKAHSEYVYVNSLEEDVQYFFPSYSWINFYGFPIILSYTSRRSVKKSSRSDSLVARTPRNFLENLYDGFIWRSVISKATYQFYHLVEQTPYIPAHEAFQKVFEGCTEDLYIEGGDFLFFHTVGGLYEIYLKHERVGFICPKQKKAIIDSDKLESDIILKALGVDNEDWH